MACLLQHIRRLLQFLQWQNRDTTLEWLGRIPNTVRKLQGEPLLELADVSTPAASTVVHSRMLKFGCIWSTLSTGPWILCPYWSALKN